MFFLACILSCGLLTGYKRPFFQQLGPGWGAIKGIIFSEMLIWIPKASQRSNHTGCERN